MTPQERELLANLVARLKQAPPAAKDAEAEAAIGALMRETPDAPYLLAQTVLVQDYALHQAQARIAELEHQAQPQGAAGGGSFLGAIFGGGAAARPQPTPQPVPTAAGPWGGAAAQASAPSFLRSAAATAAGVAGGALLFQGIESLLGAGRSSWMGMAPAPGLTETVVNNYYDSAPEGQGAADPGNAADQGLADADDLPDDPGGYDDPGDDLQTL